MSRVLVTGVSGFIGRHLMQSLGPLGLTLRGTSRGPVHMAREVDEWIPADLLRDDINLQELCCGCRWVIHLAGLAHRSGMPASQYENANTRVTRRLAEAAAVVGVRQFVYLSTAKVHGEGQVPGHAAAWSEADRPNPADAYAQSKWAAEEALRNVCRFSEMECTVIRPPLVYGPGVRANFLALMKAVHAGLPLPLASVRNRRSLVYVENLCDVLLRVLDHARSLNRGYLVADATLSTPELVRHVAETMSVTPRLYRCPPAVLGAAAALAGKRSLVQRLTQSFELDTRSLRGNLDWQPPVSLAEGLRRTAQWFLDDRQVG